MALTRTTMSAAIALADKFITIASITGLQVGMPIIVDGEEMRCLSLPASGAATDPVGVIRGVNGTNAVAHPITAGAVFGPAGDFAPGSHSPIDRPRDIQSYTAAGAIALPVPGHDVCAILNSTVALAMTLVDPGKANDGDVLTIVGNGKAAHTVTYTSGLGAGGANLDLLTFAAGGQQSIQLIAANSCWVPLPSVLAGTLTNITITAS